LQDVFVASFVFVVPCRAEDQRMIAAETLPRADKVDEWEIGLRRKEQRPLAEHATLVRFCRLPGPLHVSALNAERAIGRTCDVDSRDDKRKRRSGWTSSAKIE
jgi:chorismate-pyruvate lyase